MRTTTALGVTLIPSPATTPVNSDPPVPITISIGLSEVPKTCRPSFNRSAFPMRIDLMNVPGGNGVTLSLKSPVFARIEKLPAPDTVPLGGRGGVAADAGVAGVAGTAAVALGVAM